MIVDRCSIPMGGTMPTDVLERVPSEIEDRLADLSGAVRCVVPM
jgi:hypothetical protein